MVQCRPQNLCQLFSGIQGGNLDIVFVTINTSLADSDPLSEFLLGEALFLPQLPESESKIKYLSIPHIKAPHVLYYIGALYPNTFILYYKNSRLS